MILCHKEFKIVNLLKIMLIKIDKQFSLDVLIKT